MPSHAEAAATLLAVFEGPERLVAYRDGGGVWTVGRGHTGSDVIEGTRITHAQAVAHFAEDQAPLLSLVTELPVLAAAAYVSFGYNCGQGKLAAVLAGKDAIGNPAHTTDRHGIVENGLVSRRALEMLLIAAS